MGDEAGTEETALVLEEFTRGFIIHTCKILSGQYAQSSGTCEAYSSCAKGGIWGGGIWGGGTRGGGIWGNHGSLEAFIRSESERFRQAELGERTFQVRGGGGKAGGSKPMAASFSSLASSVVHLYLYNRVAGLPMPNPHGSAYLFIPTKCDHSQRAYLSLLADFLCL